MARAARARFPGQSSPAASHRATVNGKDLTGWHTDIPKAAEQPDLPASFVAQRGLLISRGRPQGHLITDRSYHNYRLVVEYRWPGKPGELRRAGARDRAADALQDVPSFRRVPTASRQRG